jgi:uncharacterized membrane protein YgcG
MNSADKEHVPNEPMDLEEGLPLLVGDSYDQPLQNPFQEELPEDLPIDQKRLLLVWLIAASVMSVMVFDSVVLNANAEAMFFFITAGNVVVVSGLLVGKFYSQRAFSSLVWLYSGILIGAIVISWTN